MSEEELQEKLSQELNRRKNAERRLDYLRQKVGEETKTFQGEDHKDFLHIFHSVEKESLSEDMKVSGRRRKRRYCRQVPKDTDGTLSCFYLFN